jgi:hypothetical protein
MYPYTKSKPCYDWRSVSQYVFVSRPLWNLWPDITFCLKFAVLSLWGALSDERSGLSLVSHCRQYVTHCQNVILFTFYMSHVFCIYNIHKTSVSPGSVQQIMSHLRIPFSLNLLVKYNCVSCTVPCDSVFSFPSTGFRGYIEQSRQDQGVKTIQAASLTF